MKLTKGKATRVLHRVEEDLEILRTYGVAVAVKAQLASEGKPHGRAAVKRRIEELAAEALEEQLSAAAFGLRRALDANVLRPDLVAVDGGKK